MQPASTPRPLTPNLHSRCAHVVLCTVQYSTALRYSSQGDMLSESFFSLPSEAVPSLSQEGRREGGCSSVRTSSMAHTQTCRGGGRKGGKADS